MFFVLYLFVSVVIVFTAIKLAKYTGLLEKKTKVSGALLGGVLLASVTSLPELFASLSAVVLFNDPLLSMGNILGSNIFNLGFMALFLVFALGAFSKSKMSKANIAYFLFVLGIYLVLFLGVFVDINIQIPFISISIITIAILIIYSSGVYKISKMPIEENLLSEPDTSPLSAKQVVVRFIIACVVLVAASVGLTFASTEIEKILNLGAGLAGAVLIGCTTSIPEITATLALIKKRNFNMAVSNIIGSNLFNLIIICVCDIFYFKGTVYSGLQNDSQIKYLIYFGLFSTVTGLILVLLSRRINNKVIYFSLLLLIVLSYLGFLIFSSIYL